jgi:hypothetical protein
MEPWAVVAGYANHYDRAGRFMLHEGTSLPTPITHDFEILIAL